MPADTSTGATAMTSTTGVDVSAARAALKGVPHEPGAPKPDPVVVVDGVRRTFGGLTAVDVEHVEIQRGVITALIGPNGAGKTTFFNLLTGFDRPDEGDWSFNGKSLKGVPAYRVSRLGMVRTFSSPRCSHGSRCWRTCEWATPGSVARACSARCSRRSGAARRSSTPSAPTACSSGSC